MVLLQNRSSKPLVVKSLLCIRDVPYFHIVWFWVIGDDTMKGKGIKADRMEYFKEKLLAKRHELLGVRSELQTESLDRSSQSDQTGDLSAVPIHQADIGSDAFEQEMNLERLERENELIQAIDLALEKIEEGRYGICERDGKSIPEARLEAMPWARYCVKCQEKSEHAR